MLLKEVSGKIKVQLKHRYHNTCQSKSRVKIFKKNIFLNITHTTVKGCI